MMSRDFTYIDDIVEGVVRVLDKPAESNPNWSGEAPDPGSSLAPWRVYNIGNNSPVELVDYISAIEDSLGIKVENTFSLFESNVSFPFGTVTENIIFNGE